MWLIILSLNWLNSVKVIQGKFKQFYLFVYFWKWIHNRHLRWERRHYKILEQWSYALFFCKFCPFVEISNITSLFPYFQFVENIFYQSRHYMMNQTKWWLYLLYQHHHWLPRYAMVFISLVHLSCCFYSSTKKLQYYKCVFRHRCWIYLFMDFNTFEGFETRSQWDLKEVSRGQLGPRTPKYSHCRSIANNIYQRGTLLTKITLSAVQSSRWSFFHNAIFCS